MSPSEIPISKTKIVLPKRRAELLTRKRLLDSLYEILDRKLIMVSAPAGYGKTSLLIDLAHHSDLAFCWLALDPLDREPQRFIAYLIAALAERFPQFGNRTLSMLNTLTGLDDGMERLLVTLVNEIYDEIQEHFVLVLDDFHLLDEVEIIQYFVNRFIQLVGENCHLILASRSLPELSDITLLVAREQVGGLDFSDLSFRPEEIQALLAQNQQIHLSDEDARKLVEATEGWVTGLQFTDVNLVRTDGTGFRPSHGVGVSVFDYLGQQVLEHQSEGLRIFLLRSSLLEEFDISLCEAVLAPLYPEPQNWSKLLDTIVQKNLFTLPVGANGQWLRYHHLFRDYLQERFRREYPEEVRPILERLARFNETRGGWEKAYQLYKQLGDINALADLVERAGIPMYQHAMLTLDSWLKDLPPSIVRIRPGLLSLQGAMESLKGNPSEGVALFDQAISKFRKAKDIPGLALTLARRGNTHRFLGNYQDAIRDADEALVLTRMKDDLQWIYADALRVKGLSLHWQGQTTLAVSALENALGIYVRLNDIPSIPILLMETGMVYATMGNYSQTRASYEKALEIWRRAGNLQLQANLLNNLGVLQHHQGDYEQAVRSFEDGLLCAQQSGYKRMEALIFVSMGDLYSDLEDFEIVVQNYWRARGLVQQLDEHFLSNYLALAEINLALLKRDSQMAGRALEEIASSFDIKNSRYEYGLYQLMAGRLLLQDGKPEQAVTKLMEARQCFAQDGREMESVWSIVWLVASQYQSGRQAEAREEIKKIFPKPDQINNFTLVFFRQAREWLQDLRNDREIRPLVRVLFEKADRLDSQLPRSRRQLRRLARTIEVTSPSLNIHAFGQGQVWINGRLVTITEWQTQSVRELFFYFLAENRPLTKEQIGEALWPDTSEPARLKLRFKNEIYRLRRAVGQDAILFENDRYRFNSSMDHEYDLEAFEAYLAKAKAASAPAEQIEFFQKAVDLVHGKYLEDVDATWVWPERERLSQEFISASLKLAELYVKEGQNPKALQVCQRALEHDATFEAAYRLMMQIYHRMGDRASIIHVFEICEQSMQKIFDLPPSEETRKLYQHLVAS
jgi:LuxR family transcriptional regulator, maltose regulon positive regulatory protein